MLLGATNYVSDLVVRLLEEGCEQVTVADNLEQVTDNFDVLVMCNGGQKPVPDDPPRVQLGKLELDRMRQCVRYDGEEVLLRPHEYRILETLMLNSGEVVSRDRIRSAVWPGLPQASNAVDVHLGHLRRKLLKACGTPVIHTARGRGYTLRVPVRGREGKPNAHPRD